MNKINLTGRYMSTYSFVGRNKIEKEADKILGKGWEAEEDVNQIQRLCNSIDMNEYYVSLIPDCKYEDDILVVRKDRIEIDNSKLLECVTEITTQITEEKFDDAWEYNRPTGSKFTDEAQDFFNERYDEIEHLILSTLDLKVNRS